MARKTARTQSIRTKITLVTACAVFATIVITAILGTVTIRGIGNSSSEQLLHLLCETGQKNLNSYFSSVEQSVEMVSSFVGEDLKSLEPAELEAHVERTRSIFAKTARKTNGILTYYYRIDPAVSDTEKGFWFTNLDGDDFEEHEVTDITLYDTEDTSALVWFTVPKSTGKAVWLPPYITDNLDVKVLSYNVPVYCGNTFVGVIGIEIDYSTVASQVDHIRLYDDGYAYINDYEGKIIYHPRMSDEEIAEESTRQAPYGMLEADSLIRYTYGGVDKEAVWLPLNNGMRLNVTVPVSEINEGWQKWVIEHGAICLVLLILSTFLTVKLAGHIAKPLTDLTKAAKQVEAGNYDVTLIPQGNDEVGILTGAFSHLVSHLKSYVRDLRDMAYGDALTAVRNKGAFILFLKKLTEQSASQEEPLEYAICFFDCNNLKSVNDQYGHDKGDLYLKTACATICQVFAHSPVFRIGGDEFAAILQHKEYENRNELLALFDQRCFDLRAVSTNPWEKVDVARGMAEYDPKKDHSVEDVIRRADHLMYENKRKQKKESPIS
ncbi:MAG: diguanylate cyclase [Clostridia bacterium]|nr:diguanylate cyclase [Clostridia bacterium]